MYLDVGHVHIMLFDSLNSSLMIGNVTVTNIIASVKYWCRFLTLPFYKITAQYSSCNFDLPSLISLISADFPPNTRARIACVRIDPTLISSRNCYILTAHQNHLSRSI